MEASYESYTHWRAEITAKANVTLDAAYCTERIEALSNEQDPSTKAFLKTYGSAHRDQILRWFEQALGEA